VVICAVVDFWSDALGGEHRVVGGDFQAVVIGANDFSGGALIH
jgi:hypothetical protein